jgi:Tfp pilus assembly protein PilE
MRTSRSAFTLVELQVVIAVIVILMGMLIQAISIVKGHAKKAKVRALISQVAGGLEAFRNVNSIYPESTSKKTPVNTSDPFLDAFATGSGSPMTVIAASAWGYQPIADAKRAIKIGINSAIAESFGVAGVVFFKIDKEEDPAIWKLF